MDKDVQERFERIERNLEHATERIGQIAEGSVQFNERISQITDAHIELENAQLNAQKAHDRLSSKVEDITERLADLTILVDRLIKRDLGRT